MDKLKNSIEEANTAVNKEREKNVSLLHLIFPPDIAKRLWLGAYTNDTNQSKPERFAFSGESIEAKTHEDVTMLFSDIVGFTSICSTATPMMVINMLQNLYNQFDVFCGQLDVYKVRKFDFRLVWLAGVCGFVFGSMGRGFTNENKGQIILHWSDNILNQAF